MRARAHFGTIILSISAVILNGQNLQASMVSRSRRSFVNTKVMNWIRSNVSPETELPFSFFIDDSDKEKIYSQMGTTYSIESIIERMIVEEGLVIYDGAVGQIALAHSAAEGDLQRASRPIDVYWKGSLGHLANIRAGYPINQFIYDPKDPDAVSSDLEAKGQRGFIFRIINANGRYVTEDPLDGKTTAPNFPTYPTVHWEDWKPIAGENAWVVMSGAHLYYQKYCSLSDGCPTRPVDVVELKLSEELARAALLLQAENGGIRMAPLGTYRNPRDFRGEEDAGGAWWYNRISSENNISWYSAFRMLYEITRKDIYLEAMERIGSYLKSVWNDEDKYLAQGMFYANGTWVPTDEHFALDVQTWGVAALGCAKIDEMFGRGAAYLMWRNAKLFSGVRNDFGAVIGVGYTQENDRISVEWTAGAILAARLIADHYRDSFPQWSQEAALDAKNMREGIENLRVEVSGQQSAYSYSSKRGWIPFGWYSHDPEVLSLASSGWVVLIDENINPFYLH